MHRRQLEIIDPCANDWAQMQGTSAVRHCKSCDKDVYDLSMLTEREARAALAVRPASVCMRYRTDAEGEIIFYPETASYLHAVARPTIAAALAASLLTAQPLSVIAQEAPAAEVADEKHAASNGDASGDAHEEKKEDRPTPVTAEDATSCDPRWKEAFKKAGNRPPACCFDELEVMGGMRPGPRRSSDEVSRGVPTRDQLLAAFRQVQAEITAGKCKGTGVATASIQLVSSGKVAKVSVSGVDAAAAACVEQLVRKAQVPAFTKATFELKYPFKLAR